MNSESFVDTKIRGESGQCHNKIYVCMYAHIYLNAIFILITAMFSFNLLYIHTYICLIQYIMQPRRLSDENLKTKIDYCDAKIIFLTLMNHINEPNKIPK